MKPNTDDPIAPTEPAPPPIPTDARALTRIGWAVVIAGFGGFLLWASLAPLDKGVPISGTVVVDSNRKAVQHLSGGTVEAILVREGDRVNAGDVVVRMNAVQARANAEMARVQYFAARATEARLIAERDGQKSIALPTELGVADDDPRVAGHVRLQQQLFASRQAALHSELGAIDENIRGLAQQIQGLQESRDSKRLQLAFLKEQLESMRDLAREGYVARNRLLELERTYAQVGGQISEDIGNIGRGQRQMAELKLRRLQRQQEFQNEVRTQLADTQKEAQALVSRLSALDYELNNVMVKAPVTGIVVGIDVFTAGGVIAPGFRLMDIVPSDDPLIVEGQVPVHLIDKVHPELPVELIFAAFNQNRTPHVPGIVTQVSADRMVNEKTGQPYYTLKARVAPEGRAMIAHLAVKPGMPVELFIKTGERTMMNYLLRPLMDRSHMAMTEE